jgi:signal transduction histidine kinase
VQIEGMSMPKSEPPRILIVDDEAEQMRALCNTLPDQGYETAGFTDGESALESLRSAKYDLLLADLMMPRMDGIALLQAAQKIDPDLVGVIMTGEGTIVTAVEAMKTGALDYILKPFKLSVILPVLSRALTVRRLRIENKELEQSVRERTSQLEVANRELEAANKELEAANKELEAFSHSVSHDLRGPLTVIVGSADLLVEDYAAQMPAQAHQLLRGVLGSGERMIQIVDDLLRLSRPGRQPLSKRQVNVSALVREVLDELQREQSGRQIDIRMGDLPECIGDPGLLTQVFVNLLSNAFKFTRGKGNPTVEVSCLQQAGEKIYFVRDNGAGFDMQQATKLFGAFQRFHSAEQFEGTGIGLSTVHRIIQRHVGRIWAEAEVDKGATIYFGLPD